MFSVYQVMANTSMDGRGASHSAGVYLHEADALASKYEFDKDTYASAYIRELTVYECTKEEAEQKQAELREKEIAKLTKDELAALGVVL